MATTPTQNSVPSESPLDLKYNAGKIDEFVTSLAQQYIDRFGNAHYTIEGLKQLALQQIYNLGWNLKGTFQGGGTVTAAGDLLQDTSTGIWYRWDDLSSLPKTVPAGSTPSSAGGTGPGKWQSVDVTDVLRKDLAKDSGATLIGTEGGNTVQDELNNLNIYLTGSISATYRLKNLKLLASANKRLKYGESLQIVCVGDSMTAGYDVNSADKVPADNGDWATHAPIQYPLQVQTQLNTYTSSPTTVINRGYSGDTAKACFNRWNTNPNAHVAHIMLGINDALSSSGTTFDEYVDYMEKLIKKYIDWGCGIVLHTVTAKTFNNVNDLSTCFTQSLRAIAEVYGCPVFESEEVHQFRIYSAVHSDGTHFNKTGYALYGDAVTSFILAGGWVNQYRKVNGLTHIQTGRGSEGIGFFSKNAVLATDLTNSYLTNGSLGRIPAGSSGVVSYHFYMDCDVANISVIGNITDCLVSISRLYDGGDSASNRLTIKSNQNRRVTETSSAIVQAGRSGSGRNTLAGTLVGRGWKTLFIQFDGRQTVDRYVQGIIIEPMMGSEVSQLNFGDFRKAKDEVLIAQYPGYTYNSSASSVPAAVSISGDKFIPLPDGLFPFVGPATNFFDSAPVYVTIEVFGSSDNTNHPNGITQLILRRSGTSTSLTIEKIYSTSPNSLIPTAAGIGSSAYVEGSPGPTSVNKTVDPTATQQGWLWLTFPSSSYTAYYRIEVRCASKGTQSTWMA
ncbi:GDSL-type esterase/lipase family protein [Enterobacter hormaechei]|uniref:tail fiber/spike domain-containing protein n=1 Tax=Enterobacter hormaechei TaxID=158836 RepID=UPI00254D4EFC|nr:GDSL-type esterase/lipase family protein [Enterobacter hormaechei]MEC5518016.1 GDSL-type esterase/lipase family protein [Enterobacter hormaechei]